LRIIGLARNTFREGVRDRLFVVIGVFAVAILAASFIIGPLSLGEQERITQDLGLASISVLTFLIAILIGTGIVYKEIERKTIYTVLSKPVSRWKFIVGKFLGLNAIVAVLVVGMTAILMIVNTVVTRTFQPALLTAVFLIWMELVLLTALSVLMSTLCSPILGAIFTLLLYIAGHTSADLKELAVRFGSASVKALAHFGYYVLPNLEYLNVKSKVIHGVHVDGTYVAFATSYALLYTVIFLTLAILVFQRREFR
jgi:ABC-type transport system involved in multi-copper enzyme maturation permease subunit